jgi:hypothetical protein
MSSYSDHQHPQEREPKQSLYMKISGTSSNTIASPRSPTSGLHDLIYMNLMEKVSPQTTNKSPTLQTKSQQHPNHNQKIPVTTNPCSTTHYQLNEQLHYQQHQEPPTHTTEENPKSYCQQTHTALASLLLAKNNNRPQLIWQLRLLQLQQQRLLSDLEHPQPQPSLLPWLLNKLQTIYRPLCREPLGALEDLKALEDLADLAALEEEDLPPLHQLFPWEEMPPQQTWMTK